MTQKKLKETTVAEELTFQQDIRQYLLDHPDFFEDNPDLFTELNFAHENGRAVSLIERQVSVLRENNTELRNRLNNMVETARENDRLFEASKQLVLDLIAVDNIEQLTNRLYHSLKHDFEVEFYALSLFDNPPSPFINTPTKKEATALISPILKSEQAFCGILRENQVAFLFGEKFNNIGSVAATPLSNANNTFGVLALGNRNTHHYRSSMGTLFLSQITEILNRLIPKLSQ